VCDHQNIYVLASTNGVTLFQLNTLGLPVVGYSAWLLDQIGVADDGVVYGANLSLDGTTFAITSWSSVSSGASLNAAGAAPPVPTRPVARATVAVTRWRSAAPAPARKS